MVARVCRSCNSRVACRPRGLCWNCYYKPGNRALYPSTSKFANRGEGLGVLADRGLASAATGELPGTAAKLRVMGERAAAGFSLFHPGDPVVERVEPWAVPVMVLRGVPLSRFCEHEVRFASGGGRS